MKFQPYSSHSCFPQVDDIRINREYFVKHPTKLRITKYPEQSVYYDLEFKSAGDQETWFDKISEIHNYLKHVAKESLIFRRMNPTLQKSISMANMGSSFMKPSHRSIYDQRLADIGPERLPSQSSSEDSKVMQLFVISGESPISYLCLSLV